MSGPHLSVVVPTRDNARTIAACLASVRDTTTVPFELLVVDNASSDGTPAIAERAGARVIAAGPERSAQRNEGLHQATGDVVAFLDSDMVATEGLLDEATALIADGHQAVILSEASIGVGYWARVRRLERSCYLGDDAIEAARVFSRRTLNDVGGFDEALSAFEDWDLTARVRAAGARVARTTRIVLHDEGRLTFRSAVSRKAGYGAWLEAYRARHPELAARQLSPLRRLAAYAAHAPRLARAPLATAGLVVLKAAEAAAAATAARRGAGEADPNS